MCEFALPWKQPNNLIKLKQMLAPKFDFPKTSVEVGFGKNHYIRFEMAFILKFDQLYINNGLLFLKTNPY